MIYFTDLKIVFDALGGRQREYNWLITDLEFSAFGICDDEGIFSSDQISLLDLLNKKIVWIDGEKLTEIVNLFNIQFIWAVLSGFKKDVEIDLKNLSVIPYADGNRNFWIGNPNLQHPLAMVEIVCWDSTLALFLSKDHDLVDRFKVYFSESKDLSVYNKQ